MKISIITATYNSEATVNDTLKSVAAQTHSDIEHIIIDGLSSDHTLDIVNKFPHIAKVTSEKDSGIYDAMNKGIQKATGEVIGILNSDDFYTHKEVLSKVARAFEDRAVDVVYGDLQYVKADAVQKITRTWVAGKFNRFSFYYGWMPPHPTVFVRAEVYNRAGLFNISLKSAADYELMLRILLKNNCYAVYIPDILVRMRTGGVSNASFQNRWKANREDRQAWIMNGLKPYFFTLYLKPIRKVLQFIIK